MIVAKIKYRLSIASKKILLTLGLGSHLLKNRYGERILVFHSVDRIGETRYNSRFISQHYFEELLVHFSNHYNVISLDDFYAGKFKKGILNIALTFDDGLQNNYEFALPILEKYKMPATFYITPIYGKSEMLWPDFVDLVSFYTPKKEIIFEGKTYFKNSKNEFSQNGISLKSHCKSLAHEQIQPLFDIFKDEWNLIKKSDLAIYWELMGQDQLQQISRNPLFTIGTHGLTHANLEAISEEEAKSEIENSKRILEEIIAKPVDTFAFPFGTYRQNLIDYCKQKGFSKILLVDYKNEDDRSDEKLRDRFVVNPYISKKLFLACLLKGSYR